MRIFLTLVLFVASFYLTAQVSKSDIKVKKVDRHPFLMDHTKMLLITINDNVADSLRTYSDPGAGCTSSLFENDTGYVYIECNGNWINIDKNTGKLSLIKWNWMKGINDTYLGTFERAKDEYYSLKKLKEWKLYSYKDPVNPFEKNE